MPPKDVKKDPKAAPEEPDDEERELMERELALTYLRSKLGRYQKSQEVLAMENSKLQTALEKEKNDLRDINEILTSELKVANVVCENLEKKNAELEETYERLQSDFKQTVDRLKRERDDTVATLEARVADCEDQLKGLNDFIESKNQLEEKLAKLTTELNATRKSYQDQISDMERLHVQDRERWKRELASKIKDTKTQMLRLTDQQLELTTKRTIMENELMASELSYQSAQTERIMEKNRELTAENSQLRMQLELAKLAEQELAKRNLVYQRSIRSLLSKLKTQDEKTLGTRKENASMAEAVGDYEERIRDLTVLLQEKEYERGAMEGALQSMREEVEQWKAQQGDVCTLLMGLLGDARTLLAGGSLVPSVRPSQQGGSDGEDTEGARQAEPERTSEAPSTSSPSGQPKTHPLIAAAAQAVESRLDPMLESLPSLLQVASAESREAAVKLVVERLQQLQTAAPPLPSSLSAIAVEGGLRASQMGPYGGPVPSQEPELPRASKVPGGGVPGRSSDRLTGGASSTTLPPIGGSARATKGSIASGRPSEALTSRLQGSEYPGVEILMSQIFTDARSKSWGPKAKTVR